MFTLLGDGPQQ